YILVAVTSFLIDFGLFALISYFGPKELPLEVLVPYIGARLISGPYNFLMNNYIVFPGPEGFGRKLGRYAIVFVLNMCLGLGLLYLFDFVFPKNVGLTILKILVEAIIFVVNFFISKMFIFARKRLKKGKAE
ncbi:MAG: GtrA family protein, partial [Bacilli bacterium]|nr:GtrA family protein [Bacilli bacterium]